MANKGKVYVKLHGGPKDGQFVEYFRPLPKVIVVTEVSSASMKYHNYRRVKEYDYEYQESK